MTLGKTLVRLAVAAIATATTTSCATHTDTPKNASPVQTSGLPSQDAIQSTLTMVELVEAPVQHPQKCAPDPAKHIVCTIDGKRAFTFDQSTVQPLQVRQASAVHPSESRSWVVQISLQPAGVKTLRAQTKKLVGSKTQLGLLDQSGRVLVAATVTAPIDGGEIQVSGDYTEAQAKRIADSLA